MLPVHIMVDNETLSCRPNAHILSTGLVHFNPETFEPISQKLINIDPTRRQPGADIDPGTAQWWINQAKEAQQAAFYPEKSECIQVACSQVWRYIVDACRETWQEDAMPTISDMQHTVNLWAMPPSFDISKWEHAFSQSGLPMPWDHYHVNDVRTLINEARRRGFKRESAVRTGIHHPVSDCLYQIELLKAITVFNQQ